LIPEFRYQVSWRSHRAHPGYHHSQQTGGASEFYSHAPLTAHPDPRNIDVRATLHEPFGQLMVRVFRQRSSIPVYVLADLSASMGYGGAVNKIATVATFTLSAAYSAYRSGDPFGFFGCDHQILWDLHLPLRSYKGIPGEFQHRLTGLKALGSSAAGLSTVAPLLGRQRSLVFLVSDFHLSDDEARTILDSLVRHDVVPVIVWREAEFKDLPAWGWINLKDPETRQHRRLFMRPDLRARFVKRFLERRSELTELCLRYGRRPFFLGEQLDADALSEYFLTG
jgi:uncharacterized protein (DUF58 family)